MVRVRCYFALFRTKLSLTTSDLLEVHSIRTKSKIHRILIFILRPIHRKVPQNPISFFVFNNLKDDFKYSHFHIAISLMLIAKSTPIPQPLVYKGCKQSLDLSMKWAQIPLLGVRTIRLLTHCAERYKWKKQWYKRGEKPALSAAPTPTHFDSIL